MKKCRCYRKVQQGPGLVGVWEGVPEKMAFEVRAEGCVEVPGWRYWEEEVRFWEEGTVLDQRETD